ncbi:MAG: carboxymuconolactone decarboxylase family protein [Desulfovibrionaceae bacterium]|nr:carboxymuconolactone decarboxylase family protein [Desulfovibrionaceae bacterium]
MSILSSKAAPRLMSLLLAAALLLQCGPALAADEAGRAAPQDRAAAAAAEMQRLYGQAPVPFADTDPEFAAVRDRLIYGQIAQRGVLKQDQRQLVTLVCLAALGSESAVARQAQASLAAGVSPEAVREAVYHVTPYIGMVRAETALSAVNGVFREKGIALPLADQGTVTEETRFKDGLALQSGIFGQRILDMHKNAPEGQKDIVVDYLSAWCFGDTYTRKVLDIQMRELLTFAAIVSLGGCDGQALGHARGNLDVGNSQQMLVDALAQCLPYIGFPRTLNGLAAVNKAAAK